MGSGKLLRRAKPHSIRSSNNVSQLSALWTTLSTLFFLKAPSAADRDVRPILPTILNGHHAKSLIDTGASATLISWQTFLRIRKLGTNSLPLFPDHTILSTASGEPLKVRGRTILSHKFGNHEFWRPTIIVEGLKAESIIGADTMYDEGLVIDVKRRKVICPPAKDEVKLISTLKACSLASKSEMAIPCHLPLAKDGQEILVEENLPPELKQSLETTSAICQVRDQKLFVVVANLSDQDLHLPRGTPLASGYKASNLQQLPLEVATVQTDPVTGGAQSKIEKADLSKIPLNWRHKYQALLLRFSDVLSAHPDDIGACSDVQQTITLKEDKIACVPPYRLPIHLRDIAKTKIEKLLSAGVLRKSTSPFCSPMLLVRKPGALKDPTLASSWRLVNDFRILNSYTIRDAYPMHHVHDLLDRICQNKLWSVVDMTSGFFNQLLNENSCKFTAFGVPGLGHF
jgi:hypothetical protein